MKRHEPLILWASLLISVLNFDYRIDQISLQNLPGEMKLGEFWCNFDNAKKASPQGFNLG